MSDIYRYRGNTTVIQRTIKDDAGNPLNIAGWNLLLVINAEENPTDTTNEMARLTGVVTDAPNGKVEFSPAYSDVDYVGTFYYEIQATDATGVVSTVMKAAFIFFQDIAKPIDWIWTPDGTVGEEIAIDGSEVFWMTKRAALDKWTHQDRGGVPVIRAEMDAASSTWRTFFVVGAQVPRGGSWPLGIEISVLFYIDDGEGVLHFETTSMLHTWGDTELSLEGPYARSPTYNYSKDVDELLLSPPGLTWDMSGWVAGWYYIKMRIPDDDLTNVTMTIHPQAGPEDWKDWGLVLLNHHAPVRVGISMTQNVSNSSARVELAEIRVVAL